MWSQLKLIFVLPLLVLAAESSSSKCNGSECALRKRSIDGDLAPCTPGSKWHEECNRCVCTDNGRTVCTTWPCHPQHPDNVFKNWGRRVCHLGEVWTQNCNLCMCTGFGRISCTNHDCNRESASIINLERRMGKRSDSDSCTPGNSWKDGCKFCTCEIDGVVTCSSEECQDELSEEVEIDRKKRQSTDETGKLCKPGEKWKEGEKECECDALAIITCRLPKNETTTVAPSRGRWSSEEDSSEEDYRRKRDVIVQVNNSTGNLCNPGNRWKEGCKNCVCGDYGTVACSLEECHIPKEESSEEVEIDRKKRDTLKSCVPGTKWLDECNNRCLCQKNGGIICTAMGCINGSKINPAGSKTTKIR